MLSFFTGLLYTVEIITCLLLAGAVLLQKPKEGGLGGVIGGAGGDVFGADAGNVLVKATSILGGVFLVVTLLLACVTARSAADQSVMSGSSAAQEASAAQDAPAGQDAPAQSGS